VLFECYYAYKLHLAFAHKADLDHPADLRHRTEVREKVLERITSLYDTGYTRFQNKDWRGARQAYGKLLRMIPPKGSYGHADDPVYAKLRENISRYHAYVSGKIAEQEKTW